MSLICPTGTRVVGTALLALLLTGCGSSSNVAVADRAAPSPTPAASASLSPRTAVSATPSPGTAEADHDCPEPKSLDDLPHGANGMVMNAASLDKARSAFKRSVAQNRKVFAMYAGCQTNNTLVVYRVPGHPAFDAAAKQVIARYPGVGLKLIDTRWNYRQIHQAIRAAVARFPLLREHGIQMQSAYYVYGRDGYYEVNIGTHGDLETARRLMADLGPLVHVDSGGDVVPD